VGELKTRREAEGEDKLNKCFAIVNQLKISSSRFGYKCLNSVNKVLLFLRFTIEPIEFLKIMKPVHVGGKGIATLPPKPKTTEETRCHVQLIHSPATQLPHVPMSLYNQSTVRSIVQRLDKLTKKRYRPPEDNPEEEVCDDSSLSQ
jgi:hypothetical protein